MEINLSETEASHSDIYRVTEDLEYKRATSKPDAKILVQMTRADHDRYLVLAERDSKHRLKTSKKPDISYLRLKKPKMKIIGYLITSNSK